MLGFYAAPGDATPLFTDPQNAPSKRVTADLPKALQGYGRHLDRSKVHFLVCSGQSQPLVCATPAQLKRKQEQLQRGESGLLLGTDATTTDASAGAGGVTTATRRTKRVCTMIKAEEEEQEAVVAVV